MKCPGCGGERVSPINLDNTVFECGVCNSRFHKHGVVGVDSLRPQFDQRSPNWQLLKVVMGDDEEEGFDGQI